MAEHDVSGEARDERGRWTAGGGATGGQDERVLDVGGDQWNKDTAARLEQEYESQRDTIDKIANSASGKEVTVVGPVSSWDDLSGGVQVSVGEKFVDDNLGSEWDHEIENWHDNGDSTNDAAHQLSQDEEWKHEQLAELLASRDRDENGEARIPYSVEDLASAITLKPADDYSYKPKGWTAVDVEFDDSKLAHPDNEMSADQLALPGIESVQPHESLTPEMRKNISDAITEAFETQAEKLSSSMDPPDYLQESAKESLGTMWDEKNDEEKLEWAKGHTDYLEEEGDSEQNKTIEMPKKFDPLEAGGDTENYRATQTMAKYISTERAQQLIEERFSKEGQPDIHPEPEDVARADSRLWSGWKSSSTGDEGRLIQVAAHEELGGRLNSSHNSGINKEDSMAFANSEFSEIGGYEGVKAMVRAKWETTQYMLDKADTPIVGAYRGLSMNSSTERTEKVSSANSSIPFTKLPDIKVARNGAASFTTDRAVSNGWKQEGQRIVIRAEVPRTSVLSVPAYGINVHSEHEVVIMGTAWRDWDVWQKTAPSFDDVAIKPHVVKAAPKHKLTAAEKEHAA